MRGFLHNLLGKKNMKIAAVYLAIQAVIWVKSAFFFLWFGHGKALDFSRGAFSPGALAFDYYFHEAMHVLIGVLALLFGANLRRIEWRSLVPIVLGAVALHNVAYWATASHPSVFYSIQDFATDSVLLLAFVCAGYLLQKVPLRKKQKN
ncbi:MAG: hypothetical protein NTW59_04145 [Candidatus Diapherotrites archaeon]|nr:hypothetical protein [Candidatus Diapherotrites archaeon]